MVRAAGARELLDGPLPPADLVASLDDIDRLNAWFGGYALTLAAIRRAAAALPAARPLVVVDVGGGRGDLAARLARWARAARRPARVLVVDRDPAVLALGRARCAALPEIAFVCGDATALPLADGAAGVAAAALTLHHLEPDEAVAGLAEMGRVARGAVVVNDLLRSRPALAMVWLATRLFRAHPVSRHDGPLSVRRAYSADEVRGLAARAGLTGVVIRRHPARARLVTVAS
jgi:SAM-dependent methyltransferase